MCMAKKTNKRGAAAKVVKSRRVATKSAGAKLAAEKPAGGKPAAVGVKAKSSDVGMTVRLTHPERVVYPEQGITKRDLANYYAQVADWMLPHVVDRPLAIVRCPAGSGKPCFFQKHPGKAASDNLRQVNVSEDGKPDYHLAIDDAAGLISLVQMDVLEIHVWGSR